MFLPSTQGAAYTVNVDILVQNEDGSESLHLTGAQTIAQSSSPGSATVDGPDLSVVDSTGTDLGYDSSTPGHVTTTAGGNYAVRVQVFGEWDD